MGKLCKNPIPLATVYGGGVWKNNFARPGERPGNR